MNREEILEFVRRNTTSFMATVDDGEPCVRGMTTPHIDDSGITINNSLINFKKMNPITIIDPINKIIIYEMTHPKSKSLFHLICLLYIF